MTMTLTDEKRTAIAEKLAGMRAVQNLLIANEQQLHKECSDGDICDRMEDMLEDDQKNLGILETVITQYGIQAKPKDTVKHMVHKAQEMMKGSELNLYEKITQHAVLKNEQVMSGLLVHKAAQVVGADIEAAIGPLNAVNFQNRAHQEQLKGVMEVLGVRELTGQDPDQGVWGRVQDAIAAFSGIVGGVAAQSSDNSEVTIQDLIRQDHQKVSTLFAELEHSTDAQQCQEYFGQIYQDLSVHAKAEEDVVYPAVQPFYGVENTKELIKEQAEMSQMLNEIRALSPNSPDFNARIKQLKVVVKDHVRQEENILFATIRKNFSEVQQEQLATQFTASKKALQTKMANSVH
jgi:hemerythrin superfamily protein